MSPTKDADMEGFERQLAEIHEVPQSLGSPVNLDIREATILKLPKLSWQNYEKPPKKMKITNTGQSVVLSGKWFSERPHLKGGALSSRYVFSQIHFHWGGEPERGSEHTVDGFRMPLEMHLVHFKAEYGSQDNALLQDDGLFVIGCFFKLQTEDNPSMSALTDNLGHITRPHTSHNVALSPVATLLAEFDGDYFSYWGSMCSDHCQHTILWCFPRTLVGISRYQMLQFQHLVNDEGWPLRLDEHSVKPLGSRRLFLVNPSSTEPSTTVPGMELRDVKSSALTLDSETSIESSKATLSEELFEIKPLKPESSSALTLRSANQTIDLAAEKSLAVSRTSSAKSTRKPIELAGDDAATHVGSVGHADTRGTVLTHPASGQENKNLCGSGAGNAHSNDHLCKRSDVLELPNPQNKTVKNVKGKHIENPMPKIGSSEEILRAIEELRRNQSSLLKDIEADLDSPCPSTIVSRKDHSAENISTNAPLEEQCVQDVKRYKLKAPFIACKTDAKLPALRKARPTAAAAKTKQPSTVRQHASPLAKRSKDAPKRNSSQPQVSPDSTANEDISEELKSNMTKQSPRDNSSILDINAISARETKKSSIHSQASSTFLSTTEFGDSPKSKSSDMTSAKSSVVGDKVFYDRGTFHEDHSPVKQQEKYICAKSSHYIHNPRLPKTRDSPNSSSVKASTAHFTVSLAGCWKKPSVTKVPVIQKEVPVVKKEVPVTKKEIRGTLQEVSNVPNKLPVKCRVSPSDVISELEKLEREVHATLRHDKGGDTSFSQPSHGQEQEWRTLVQLADSLPSILGDQDSFTSLSNLEDNDATNDVISLYSRDQKQLEEVSDRVSWRKKPSSCDTRMFQSDIDEQVTNGDEWRAKRTDSLLVEATALLREHRRAVAVSYDEQNIQLPDSRDLAQLKGHP